MVRDARLRRAPHHEELEFFHGLDAGGPDGEWLEKQDHSRRVLCPKRGPYLWERIRVPAIRESTQGCALLRRSQSSPALRLILRRREAPSRRMAANPSSRPWFETPRCARLLTMRGLGGCGAMRFPSRHLLRPTALRHRYVQPAATATL